jgi:hypothetical protein
LININLMSMLIHISISIRCKETEETVTHVLLECKWLTTELSTWDHRKISGRSCRTVRFPEGFGLVEVIRYRPPLSAETLVMQNIKALCGFLRVLDWLRLFVTYHHCLYAKQTPIVDLRRTTGEEEEDESS